jgi:hypothetical protein
MRNFVHEITGYLGEFSGFRQTGGDSATKLPFGMAAAASWLGLILIFLITRDRLALLLVPFLVAFPILNRSGWHRELPVAVRSVSLVLLSLAAFGTALVMTGFLALVGIFFAVAIAGGSGPG